jgi:hypothetical protein
MERRPAAVTRLRTAADAGNPRITGAARRDRRHVVGRACLKVACASAWFAGAITRRAAKEVKP